jgi:hypothetical protein
LGMRFLDKVSLVLPFNTRQGLTYLTQLIRWRAFNSISFSRISPMTIGHVATNDATREHSMCVVIRQ